MASGLVGEELSVVVGVNAGAGVGVMGGLDVAVCVSTGLLAAVSEGETVGVIAGFGAQEARESPTIISTFRMIIFGFMRRS